MKAGGNMKQKWGNQAGGAGMWIFGAILIAIAVGAVWYNWDTISGEYEKFRAVMAEDTGDSDSGATQVKQETDEDRENCNRPGVNC